MTKRGTVILAAGAVALVLSTGTALAIGGGPTPMAATTSAPATSGRTTTSPTATSGSTTPTTPTSGTSSTRPAAVAVTEDQARRIAVAHLGGGSVTGVERESEHGRLEWKVRIALGGTGFEVRVDAASGTVTRVEGRGGSKSTPTTGVDDSGSDNSGRHGSDDRRGRGSDDNGSDDSGSDRGSDDHGGHGSDDGPGHE